MILSQLPIEKYYTHSIFRLLYKKTEGKILELIFSIAEILIVLVLIVVACIVFTNAVEHLGEELNLSEGAVGSVIAAVGTALPETLVPIVAIVGAYITGSDMEMSKEIGIGAILGAPFLLGTLAFCITGAAVIFFTRMKRRNMDMPVNTVIMFRDLHYFAIAYSISVFSSFIPVKSVKYAMAGLLLLIYLIYAIKTIRSASKIPEGGHEELEALFLTNFIKFPAGFKLPLIIMQFLLALGAIIVLAHIFVEQIKFVSDFFRINPLILSLIIAPIATELPEKFNSIIWIKNKKDTLAMGNITGAMVFQSCIPTAVGLALTPWVFETKAWINIIIVYLSVSVVYINIVANRGVLKPSALLSGGFFYLIYLIYVIYRII